jgi:hypothetical protein
MSDFNPDDIPSLRRLYDLTIRLFSDEERMTRALEWVDQVLPVFTDSCRRELHSNELEGIGLWLDWLNGESSSVIEEAGKGDVYVWRITWLKRILHISSVLREEQQWMLPEYRAGLAQSCWSANQRIPDCFPLAFWYDLIDYLCTPPQNTHGESGSGEIYTIYFPLVLSEPVVDGGSETNVILAQFVLEPVRRSVGGAFLHPCQTAVRCMDDRFAASFSQAVIAAKRDLAGAGDLPDVRVLIQTVKPGHEKFLCGTMLRGDSGGGALAVGLLNLYTGQMRSDNRLAISFALNVAGTLVVDGKCHPVGGTDDKVRGCAKQGLTRLVVAKEQQLQLALYGHKHNIQIMGAKTVSEASKASVIPNESGPKHQAEHSPRNIVLIYHHRSAQDSQLVTILETRLKENGHDVFVDRHTDVGITWAAEIERRIHQADAVIALISSTSVTSDLLAGDLLTAHEAKQKNGQTPKLLPILVDYAGVIPERIGYILESLPQLSWKPNEDPIGLLQQIETALHQMTNTLIDPPPVQVIAERSWRDQEATVPDDLEPFDGLVPLNSKFYIERETDRPFLSAVANRHSVILVKGSRQVGKSSLVARGLHQAEQNGYRVAFTDFQKFSMGDPTSIQSFYLALGRMLARQLKIDASLEKLWTPGRSANLNFEEYLEDHILPQASPLLWAMDEVDRLFFATSFSNDVFGLFRSWANERQGRATSPWQGLTMTIAYATEAHLFIKDVNQSPFNIGTRFELKDFNLNQVAELNQCYGRPMHTDAELNRFFNFVGGHPYLVRRSLYAIVTEKMEMRSFESDIVRDDGPLGDHLRRIITLLAQNDENCNAVRQILSGKHCPSFEAFYNLRSAGIVVGDSVQNARIRCRLYEAYLSRHLLSTRAAVPLRLTNPPTYVGLPTMICWMGFATASFVMC